MEITKESAIKLKALLGDYYKYPRRGQVPPSSDGAVICPQICYIMIGEVHETLPTIYNANPVIMDPDTLTYINYDPVYAIEANGIELVQNYAYLGIRSGDYEGLPLFLCESSIVSGITNCYDIPIDVNLDNCTVNKWGFHYLNGILVDVTDSCESSSEAG